jgi:hypothetical protein
MIYDVVLCVSCPRTSETTDTYVTLTLRVFSLGCIVQHDTYTRLTYDTLRVYAVRGGVPRVLSLRKKPWT